MPVAQRRRRGQEVLESPPRVAEVRNKKSCTSSMYHILILLFCFGGFLYQSISFLAIYYKYPTVVDVQIKTPQTIKLPAMTFCSISGINRHLYCYMNPKLCHYIHYAKQTQRYPNYRKVMRTIVGMLIPYSNVTDLYNLPQGEIEKYFMKYIKIEPIVLHAGNMKLHRIKFKMAPSVRSALKLPPYCNVVNYMDNPATDKSEVLKRSYSLAMVWHSESLALMFGVSHGSYQMSVHSPYNYNNPFVDGYDIKAGSGYFIDVDFVIKKTLPAPYETNCFDYIGKLKAENRPGPINRKECIEQCKMNMSLTELDCVLWKIWYPHNYRRCEPSNERTLLAEYHNKCSPKCRQPCLETSFEVKAEEQFEANMIDCENLKVVESRRRPESLLIFFRFTSSKEIIYSTKPKYEFIEVVSNLGSFVGMWLGLSLIVLYHLFENFVVYVFDAITKKRNRAQVRRFHPIQNTF